MTGAYELSLVSNVNLGVHGKVLVQIVMIL